MEPPVSDQFRTSTDNEWCKEKRGDRTSIEPRSSQNKTVEVRNMESPKQLSLTHTSPETSDSPILSLSIHSTGRPALAAPARELFVKMHSDDEPKIELVIGLGPGANAFRDQSYNERNEVQTCLRTEERYTSLSGFLRARL